MDILQGEGGSALDFFSAYAYKPGGSQSPPPAPTLPPNASSRKRAARGRGRSRESDGRGVFDPKQEKVEEEEQRPRLLTNKQRKRKSPSSSIIHIVVDGEYRIVSRYFPLPPNAVVVPDPGYPKVRKSSIDNNGSKRKRNFPGENPNDGCQPLNERTTRKQPSVQLSAAEKRSDAYRRVLGENIWKPPASCYHLLQESHCFDPWRVMVICMLLNLTTGKQVKKVLPDLFLLCPDAETATEVPQEEIEEIIRTLGLQKKRARMIKRFSCEYLRDDWTHVTQLHGIGKYAADAYAIFCAGKPRAVVPQDHMLEKYWEYVCSLDYIK